MLRKLVTAFLLTASLHPILGHTKMLPIQNPILSGFYPDPSICRVSRA